MARLVSSKHVENVSDLTLAAPIRLGFVDAIDNVTYESRLRLVMEAMFRVRSTAREYARIKPFVESAERIQSLLDFRLAVLDGFPQKKLLLSVAFDRPFEPYMRLVWDPLGPLLDLFFCNCDGYVPAAESSFPDYLKWVRSVQVDSDFFYAASNRTIVDGEYLARIERLHRDGGEPDPDIAAASEFVPFPAVAAEDLQKEVEKIHVDDLGVQALVAVGRLFDYFPPDNPDEFKYLRRAASQLLADWKWQDLDEPIKARLGEYLLALGGADKYRAEETPDEYDPKIVQGGIIVPYDDTAAGGTAALTHACLLLMRVRDATKARAFLRTVRARIGTAADGDPDRDGVNVNLAFTLCGLRHLGVPETAIERLPQEYREGMEARAGMIGDVGDSHPRRWTLPRRCAAGPGDKSAPVAAAGAPPVELSEVDLVLKLRIKDPWPGHELVGDDAHPLARHAGRLIREAGESGIELLAVETMRNATPNADGTDHFRFADGLSQPIVHPGPATPQRDRTRAGEFLLGLANDRNDPMPPPDPWWDQGTFLVVRKLKQEVQALGQFLDDAEKQIPRRYPALAHLGPAQIREEVRSKMMGRHSDGAPLIPAPDEGRNDFDYASDMRGREVPFQSHVRRTNPRVSEHKDHPVPRILRRGLSYGPPRGEGEGERGVMFMAYNASIAEQFEVIQSWINGGNSTRVASTQSDPLMGQARHGDKRTFLFRIQGVPVRLAMPQPLVKLQWGAYLFVPSLAGLDMIAEERPATPSGLALEGAAIVARIEALPRQSQALAWKTVFEDLVARDPDLGGVAPKVWAAIRAGGGAKRVPYGEPALDERGRVREAVLVASRTLLDEVLGNDATYSVAGYCPRLENSIGMIYLGRDDGDEYRAESGPANDAIYRVSAQDAFESARGAAQAFLTRFRIGYDRLFKGAEGGAKLDLANDYVTSVLAAVCARYFELPDGDEIMPGAWRWAPHDERKPVCPGDFIAPSSYIFYLDPIGGMRRRGPADGKALRAAAARHFAKRIAASRPPVQDIPLSIYDQYLGHPEAADMMARTLVGVMMGFLPPADGNLRGTLYDWIKSRALWRIQHDLAKIEPADRGQYEAVAAVIRPPLIAAMCKRPAPDALWRTAKRAARLGPVDVLPGDRIYLGIVSATAEDPADVWPVFGGNRHVQGHPTHACPAHEFAMGVMVGTLCALLEVGRIEEMPAPLIVSIPRP
ncbi:MAG TPA: hypothetical protein VGB79_09950 [Allosphingosinicella sp.]|jgi:Dyp-type peroxidase family